MALAEQLPEPSLTLIPPEHVDRVLPLVEGRLKEIEARSKGEVTVEGWVTRFKADKAQLWIIWDGTVRAIVGTSLIKVDSGALVGAIEFCHGSDSLSWLHLLEELEGFFRHHGCVKVRGTMRKGWARRLPDYKMSHVVLEKDLSDGPL